MVSLSESDVKKIRELMIQIANIAGQTVGRPFDPKVEVMLEMAHALLKEQLDLKKEYSKWAGPVPRDDRFMSDPDTPTVDDLENMFGEE